MHTQIKHPRTISQKVIGRDTHDGAGVKLKRVIPAPGLRQLDPFLLLDVFSSDNPNDYIAGFPPHPHRGFETVTYLLAGQMRHRDSAGHMGVIKAGGAQWITAASGIKHSEMPEQEDGLLHGFQLWVNLPAAKKMGPPAYQEFNPEQILEETRSNGVKLRVVSGTTLEGTTGPITTTSTDTIYLDISMPADSDYSELTPQGYNAFIYLIDGSIQIGQETVVPGELAALNDGDGVVIYSSKKSHMLLIAGRPTGEPVARHGPFVMNTQEEIEQAYRDYASGLFGEVEDAHDEVA
ncbi:MAG: pirin family protein [Gammaproteobacteria bacterium]|nr:pirin family protein [Gammaproteobacteria bacterium]